MGNLHVAQGNLDDAKAAYRRGQDILKANDDNGVSADMATCLYKLGMVALRECYASDKKKEVDTLGSAV